MIRPPLKAMGQSRLAQVVVVGWMGVLCQGPPIPAAAVEVEAVVVVVVVVRQQLAATVAWVRYPWSRWLLRR